MPIEAGEEHLQGRSILVWSCKQSPLLQRLTPFPATSEGGFLLLHSYAWDVSTFVCLWSRSIATTTTTSQIRMVVRWALIQTHHFLAMWSWAPWSVSSDSKWGLESKSQLSSLSIMRQVRKSRGGIYLYKSNRITDISYHYLFSTFLWIKTPLIWN